MSTNTEVCCPKCNSNQLSANKKGFSGTKAIGGALLTGGIGVLAGTIGSNDIIITCLACGNKFKPGEGKIKTIGQENPVIDYSSADPRKMTPEEYKIYVSEFHNWRDNFFKAYESKNFPKMDLLLEEVESLKIKYKFKDITDVATLKNADKDEHYYANIYKSLESNNSNSNGLIGILFILFVIVIFFFLFKACS